MIIVGEFLKAFIFIALLFSPLVFAQQELTKSLEDDEAKIAEAIERCETINKLLIKKSFPSGCFSNFHHYGSTSKIVKTSAQLKIANYNLLHPGTSKTMFKDYGIVAKIMNRYDIVAGLELLATVGRDEQNNKAVTAYLQTNPGTAAAQKAAALYRAPGYLKILLELKKLDASWSLILSPRGDSALIGSVEEMVGFYYRASVATPALNPHCKETAEEKSGTPVACFISLTKDFMGKDLVQHFARRPFMATFKSGSEKFSLITSHVVFTYSGDEEASIDLMKKTFGVESYKDLGVAGINSVNFARYAEVKNTLEFMSRYKTKYKDDKVIFMSDMNLVSNNPFWPEVLKSFPGSELWIDEASTISPTRYLSNKSETGGVANDYDHFILNPKSFPGCSKGEVYNYFKAPVFKEIESKYIIRKEVVGFHNKSFDLFNNEPILDGDIPPADDPTTIKLEYPLTPAGQSKMDKFVSLYEKQLKQIFTIKRNEIVQDDTLMTEKVDGMRRRVFLRQLTNPFYHRYMQEVISDHFPASINCKF